MMNSIHTEKIIIFVFISFCFSSCAIIQIHNNHLENNSINIIKKNPDVEKVQVLTNNYNGYWINIYFNNGGLLGVDNFGSKGYGKNKTIININQVNEYFVLMLDHKKMPIKDEKKLEIWSSIIGTQVNNVIDMVDNYYIISQYVEKLICLDDDNENLSAELIDKAIKNNLFPSESIMILNNETYYLIKRKQ